MRDSRLGENKQIKFTIDASEAASIIQSYDILYKDIVEDYQNLEERRQTIQSTIEKLRISYYREITQQEALTYKLENQIKVMKDEQERKIRANTK